MGNMREHMGNERERMGNEREHMGMREDIWELKETYGEWTETLRTSFVAHDLTNIWGTLESTWQYTLMSSSYMAEYDGFQTKPLYCGVVSFLQQYLTATG